MNSEWGACRWDFLRSGLTKRTYFTFKFRGSQPRGPLRLDDSLDGLTDSLKMAIFTAVVYCGERMQIIICPKKRHRGQRPGGSRCPGTELCHPHPSFRTASFFQHHCHQGLCPGLTFHLHDPSVTKGPCMTVQGPRNISQELGKRQASLWIWLSLCYVNPML